MDAGLNQESINDAAKLIMHRLIARQLARNPSLVGQAKVAHAHMSRRFPKQAFLSEWADLLTLPRARIVELLKSPAPQMKRLRLSSPFVLADGIDFTDPSIRRRIRRAAKRIVERGIGERAHLTRPS